MQIPTSVDQAQKLTTWTNEPTLAQLKLDFEMAKPSHDSQMVKIRHWNDLMLVKGKAMPPKVKGRSSVQPKLIRRQAEWRYSALSEPFLGSNKIYKVSPVSWEDEEGAKQNELLLNWQFRTKLNRVKFIDDFVRSTVDEGTSILRTGWVRNTVQVNQKAPVYTYYQIEDEAQGKQLEAALALRDENPKGYSEQVPLNVQAAVDYYDETSQPTYAAQTGVETVKVDKVVENRPTVDVIDPQNFYLDPTCNGDIDKALFGIVSFETNQAELKKNPKRYKNLDKVNWETSTPVTEPDHATQISDQAQFRDVLRKKVVAYEYWGFFDAMGDGVLVPIVATWIGSVMIRMEKNPFPDQKIPFVLVPYLPVKRNAFGEPDAELLEDNQKILGAVTRGMIDSMGRSANAQRGSSKGLLDPLNRRKFEAGEDYEFNPQMNPTSGLIEHKYPDIPQSAMIMLNLQNQEAEALTGVKAFSGGVSGAAYGDVAAGIKGALDASAKREMAILRRLAQGITQVGHKLISMNAAFLSEKEVIRVTNSDYVQMSPPAQGEEDQIKSKNEFVTINREDLAGNFDLEVDISTSEVDNAKAQDLAFMVQTIGPNIDVGITMMMLSDIAELKRMPALAHKIRNYQPQPDPMAEEMKKLELEAAKKEIEKLDSEIALNNAKAEEAKSKKDMMDLDFVEQETGTKHARDLDKQGGQARANADLTVTKALVAPRKPDQSKPDIEAAVGYNDLVEARDRAKTIPAPAPQPVIEEPQFQEEFPEQFPEEIDSLPQPQPVEELVPQY